MTPGRLRAPREHGAVLAAPPLDQAGTILDYNRKLFENLPVPFLGRTWQEWRRQARHEALAAAATYYAQSGEPVRDVHSNSLLFAGHQPELFHPGVWVKNFALNGLARRHGATPVNLVVDNDAVKSTALRLPVLDQATADSPAKAHLASLSFDAWTKEVPFEDRRVLEEPRFTQFLTEASKFTNSWGFQPLLSTFWPEVCREATRTPLLGERFAAARRTLERRWGCTNLELPVSKVCGTESFAAFVWHVLTHLSGFRSVYNACLQEYRQAHRIRGRHHPVPDLEADGNWLEAPFWIWQATTPRRHRLWARTQHDRVELRFGAEEGSVISARSPAEIRDFQARGIKLRSRALTTTMFVRLFLADAFLHGIGGAKYDEVTDAIMARFFKFPPPACLVVSATLLLPFAVTGEANADSVQAARLLRDLDWNPQRHMYAGVGEKALSRAQRKQQWIEVEPVGPKERRERFLALRTLTEQLRPSLKAQRLAAAAEWRARLEREHTSAVLQRRDYAFCWYSEDVLRPFCQQFLSPAALAAPTPHVSLL